MVKTPHFHCKGYRFSPCGWSSKISHAMQYSQKKFINVFKTLKQTLMCLVCIHINFQGDYMNFDSDIKCFHSFFSFPIYFLRCDLRCMSFFGVTWIKFQDSVCYLGLNDWLTNMKTFSDLVFLHVSKPWTFLLFHPFSDTMV